MTYQARLDETAEWLNYLQPEGLVVGANVLREKGLSPIRQTPIDTEEAATALGLDPEGKREDDRLLELHDPWRFFETVLGWAAKLVAGSPGGPAVDGGLNAVVPEHETLLSPDMAVLWNGVAPDGVRAQALVMLHPTLDADDRNQFAVGEWEASPHQRLERLLRETNVGVGILVARNTLRLVYAPRGETAGWLSWPLAALGRVEGRPMLAGLKLCLARNAFFTGAPETRLRALLEASREAQDKVSEKLSNQVLAALYELLRGLHRAAPERIEALAEHDAHHLYEGLLTCLMRLVFLLYAEDRDLLPSTSDPGLKQLWENGYSIKTAPDHRRGAEPGYHGRAARRLGSASRRLPSHPRRPSPLGNRARRQVVRPRCLPVPGRARQGQRTRRRRRAAGVRRDDPAHPPRADDRRGPQPLGGENT